MKYEADHKTSETDHVAPYAGAWIEIIFFKAVCRYGSVAPYAGAWIEILNEELNAALAVGSLPTRERGLKFEKSA